MKQLSNALIGFTAGILGATVVLVSTPPRHTQSTPPLRGAIPSQHVKLTSYPLSNGTEPISFTNAAERTVDAVVHVRTLERTTGAVHPWFEMFGYGGPERMAQGSGSGVIIDPSGYIVTNNHVVEGADEIQVSLNSNRTYSATLVGRDPATDLAVLRIEADEPLPALAFGNSDDVQIGEWVLAVGNPFDLTSTVTAGIVSAKSRSINILRGDPRTLEYPIESFIQTDAAVNPGNSGGALVNTQGELIGINTAIASRTGSYAGYSFAVPSGIVEKVAHDLVSFGEVRRAYLGIQIEPVDEALASELKLPAVAGCAVREIVQGSGAEKAGLKAGDVVIQIEGVAIPNFPALQECIARFHPGDVVQVEIIRQGQPTIVDVQLTNRNGLIDAPEDTSAEINQEIEWLETCQAGFISVPAGLAKSLNLKHGVQVASLKEGKFSNAGIRKGFIVTKINGETIESMNQLVSFFKGSEGGLLIEGIYPNGAKAYYGVAIRD